MKQHKIEQRLRQYLRRDKEGVRKNLIKIFLTGGKYTVEDVFNLGVDYVHPQDLREKAGKGD